MSDQWKATYRLDSDGDPVFLAPDGGLWAISRDVGSPAEILARLNGGPAIPWSRMERIGHSDDWVVSARSRGEEPWDRILESIVGRMKSLGEDVMCHDWERGDGYVYRGRLDEARAREIGGGLAEIRGLDVEVRPVLGHLPEDGRDVRDGG